MTRKPNVSTQLRPYIFLALSTLIMLIAGGMTLLWQMQREQRTRADGGNIVGPPSLPASTVDAIFARAGSPMVGTGKVVEQVSAQANVDDAFALAVWWAETNDGAAGVGRTNRNPGGVRGSPSFPSAYSYTMYPSYSAAVTDWFNVLKGRYVSRGLTSAYTICYPYVGTSNAAHWADKVVALMLGYRGAAPPVKPTPTVSITPSPAAYGRSHVVAMQPENGMQQSSVGQSGTQQAVGGSQATDTQPRQQYVQQAPAQSGADQNLFITLALLSAVVLALWGMMMRRRMVVPLAPIEQSSNTTMAYPPLFSNEFSPVIERRTTELLPFPLAATTAWSPLPAVPASPIATIARSPFPSLPISPMPEVGQVPFPSVPASPITMPTQLPFPTIPISDYGSGLFAHYPDAMRPRHIVLLPSNMKGERASVWPEENKNPVTEALPSPIGVKLPVRKPEPVSASSGGLLRRYGSGGQ
jgi:hypothetical protein